METPTTEQTREAILRELVAGESGIEFVRSGLKVFRQAYFGVKGQGPGVAQMEFTREEVRTALLSDALSKEDYERAAELKRLVTQ